MKSSLVSTVLINRWSYWQLHLPLASCPLQQICPATWVGMAHRLVLCSPQSKNDFYLFKWLGEKISWDSRLYKICIFLSVNSCVTAFVLQWQSWVVVIVTVWPQKLNYSFSDPLQRKLADLCFVIWSASMHHVHHCVRVCSLSRVWFLGQHVFKWIYKKVLLCCDFWWKVCRSFLNCFQRNSLLPSLFLNVTIIFHLNEVHALFSFLGSHNSLHATFAYNIRGSFGVYLKFWGIFYVREKTTRVCFTTWERKGSFGGLFNSSGLSLSFSDYLCKPEDNIYSIDFTRFKIRDLETGTVLFEIAKPCVSGRSQYRINSSQLTVGAKSLWGLSFCVPSHPVSWTPARPASEPPPKAWPAGLKLCLLGIYFALVLGSTAFCLYQLMESSHLHEGLSSLSSR